MLGASTHASVVVAAVCKELGGRAALSMVARLAAAVGISVEADAAVEDTKITSAQVSAPLQQSPQASDHASVTPRLAA